MAEELGHARENITAAYLGGMVRERLTSSRARGMPDASAGHQFIAKAIYRRSNEIERLFRRLKGFRRIFSRFEKLDVMFTAFIHFALIADALR